MVDNVDAATPVLYHVHVDHLKGPARMARQNSSPLWGLIYSPFGATSYIFGIAAKLDARFLGQWLPLESGLE